MAEAGDWFNSQYLIMWGTNLPLTRTPDAHFLASRNMSSRTPRT